MNDDPAVVVLVKTGPSVDQWPYLFFLTLTSIVGLLVWRCRWPRLTAALAGVALVLSAAFVVSAVVDASSLCRGYVAFAPHNRVVALLETLFVGVKLGLLVFVAASGAATAAALRHWHRGKKALPGGER